MKHKHLFIIMICVALAYFLLDREKEVVPSDPLLLKKTDEPAPPIKSHNKQLIVFGRVFAGPEREPVVGAAVYHQTPGGSWRRLSKPTDGFGRFVFRPRRHGIHRWYARKGKDISFNAFHPPTHTAIGPQQQGRVSVRLDLYRAVGWELTLRDENTLKPIGGAEIRPPALLGAASFSDTNGRASLILPRDTWPVTIYSPGYAPRVVYLGFTEENDASLDIYLKPGNQLEGRIVDRGGLPIASVQAALSNEPFSQRLFSDNKGRFLLQGLPREGVGRLSLQKPGYRTQTIRDLSWVDGAGPLEIVMEAETRGRAVITGQVQDLFARPIAGAQVALAAEPMNQNVLTDDDGLFVLNGPPLNGEQLYQLLVRAPGHQAKVVPFQPDTVTGVTKIRTALVPGQVISGVILDEQGRPLEGVPVTAGIISEPLVSSVTLSDQQGRFFFNDQGGRIRLSASQPGYATAALEADVAGGEHFRLTLLRQGWFKGRVLDEQSELPIDHFRLSLLEITDGDPPGEVLPWAKSGAMFNDHDGRFQIMGPPHGRGCRLRLEAEGYLPRIVFLESSADSDPQTLYLSRRGNRLMGYVTGPIDDLSNCKITAFTRRYPRDFVFPWDSWFQGFAPEDLVFERKASTARDGSFVLPDLPRDTALSLLVEGPGMAVHLVEEVTFTESWERNHFQALPRPIRLEPEGRIECNINRTRFPNTVLLRLEGLSAPHITRRLLLPPGEEHVVFERLPTGLYNLALKRFEPDGQMLTVANELDRVAVGETLSVNMGFEPVYRVAGTVRENGVRAAQARLFLQAVDRESLHYRTTSDAEGRFLFEHVPAGEYALVYLNALPFHPDDLGALKAEHPNRQDLSVSGDMVFQPDFAALARLHACIGRDALDWRLTLYGKTRAGTYYERSGQTDEEGCLQLNHLPEGKYGLRAEVDNEEFVVNPLIQIPPNGLVDLGRIAPHEPGRLHLHTSNPDQLKGIFQVQVFPGFHGAEMTPLMEEVRPRFQEDLDLNDIPAGPVSVVVSLDNEAAVAWPSSQVVRILPHATQTADVQLVPITRLNVRFVGKGVVALDLIHRESGAEVSPIRSETLPKRARDLEPLALMNEEGAVAMNLPAGAWTLHLHLSTGTIRRELGLVPGIVTELTLE